MNREHWNVSTQGSGLVVNEVKWDYNHEVLGSDVSWGKKPWFLSIYPSLDGRTYLILVWWEVAGILWWCKQAGLDTMIEKKYWNISKGMGFSVALISLLTIFPRLLFFRSLAYGNLIPTCVWLLALLIISYVTLLYYRFQVKKKQFFVNFITIMMFGAIGTLVSCAIITLGIIRRIISILWFYIIEKAHFVSFIG